jgi:AraC-like DNA-binding protein
MVLNSALRQVGIRRDGPDRVGKVEIEKEPGGEPSGRLIGAVNTYYSNEPYTESLLKQMPLLDPGAIGPAAVRGMREFNSMGVTTGYEGHAMDFPLIAGYQWLRSEERLSMRILCAPEAEPSGLPWSSLLARDADERFSVTEVCFEVGCSSLGTFSTRSTELVGMPPSVYRRQAASAMAGMTPCVAKQVTRPIRNREAPAPGRS